MAKEFKIVSEIALEIRRLEELYKHDKKVYRRVQLCCSNQKETAKHNKDHYKRN